MLKDVSLVAVINRDEKILTFYKRKSDFTFGRGDAIMRVTGIEENGDKLTLVGQEVVMRKVPSGLLSKSYLETLDLEKPYEEFEHQNITIKHATLKWPFVRKETVERAVVEDKCYATKHNVAAAIELSRNEFSICDYSGSFLVQEVDTKDK